MNFIAYRPPLTGGKSCDSPSSMRAGLYIVGNPDKFTSRPLSINHSEGKAFVVSPFSPLEEPLIYPVVKKVDRIPSKELELADLDFPVFTKEDYFNYISAIRQQLDGNPDHKVVASRRLSTPLPDVSPESVVRMFHTLCNAYPSAYVFLISTHEFGTWIGASPELLLQRHGNILSTMALAGTRETGTTYTPWDGKNIREQSIVTEYIVSVMKDAGMDPTAGPTQTVKAGPIEHLMTPIKGHLQNDGDVLPLLRSLSPTPALAGSPREDALDIISRFEGDRKLYGGYFGPVEGDGFTFNVILRCAAIGVRQGGFNSAPLPAAVLFAGGGVTALSDPQSEWEETNRKLNTLLPFLRFSICEQNE